ncbi:tryptophan synthase subunit beta, partial [Dehalococcoidia bacterium]|nr:tryptophan synthase subunit beta [Dehalococcoidia bacterium]
MDNQQHPDADGHFGEFGGKFVPETLMPALEVLEQEYASACDDERFQTELKSLMRDYAGRPTSLYFAENLTREAGGARIYLKREDLAHT